MFIWRDDLIGNKIAQAVLEAADRGVKVEISVDRYGVILEKSEEVKKSFFHKEQTFVEKLKIKALECIYPMQGAPKKGEDEYTELYEKSCAIKTLRCKRTYSKPIIASFISSIVKSSFWVG